MKKILATLAGGLLIGAVAASYSKLPSPTPEERSAAVAKAEKDATAKAKAAKELANSQDKAVANYKKNRSLPSGSGATAKQKSEPNASRAPL